MTRSNVGMLSVVLLFAAAALLPGRVLAQDEVEIPPALAEDQCIVCHNDVGYLPDGFLMDATHMRVGLSCVGCHGGDATTDDEEIAHAGDWVGAPSKAQIPAFCGKCHSDLAFMRTWSPSASTDQVSNYFTSMHGQKLREGDRKVAECSSCHTAHAILPASDARSTVHPLNVPGTCNECHGDADYMSEYGIRTNQYEKYAVSVHGKALLDRQDLGAPACNDCHGNHGAQPPGIESIDHVCGMCHVNNADYFDASEMGAAFRDEDLHGCEECHGIHDVSAAFDEMAGIGDDSVCTTCHDEGDDGWEAARIMGEQLAMITAAQDSANVMLESVRTAGMDDIEIGFLLRDAHEAHIQARTFVHTFDPARTATATDAGIAKAREASMLGQAELENFRFRRFGFGTATLMITFLTVALYLKIREIDRRSA